MRKNLQGAENKIVRLWYKQSGGTERGWSLDNVCPVKPTMEKKAVAERGLMWRLWLGVSLWLGITPDPDWKECRQVLHEAALFSVNLEAEVKPPDSCWGGTSCPFWLEKTLWRLQRSWKSRVSLAEVQCAHERVAEKRNASCWSSRAKRGRATEQQGRAAVGASSLFCKSLTTWAAALKF